MPVARFQMPDGRIGRFEVPEGTTPEQAQAMIGDFMKGSASADAPIDPTEGMTGTDKFLAGTGKAFVDLARGAGQMVGLVDQADVDAAKERDTALMKTGAGMAGSFAGNLAAFLPTALIPGANTLTGAAAIGAASGALQPVASDESRLANVGIGAAGGAGGNLIGRGIGRLISPVSKTITPRAEAIGRRAEEMGATLTPGQRTGSAALQKFEASMEAFPPTAGRMADLKAGNQAVINRAVARSIGENADTVTDEVLGAAEKRIGNIYKMVAGNQKAKPDAQAISAQLAAIADDTKGVLQRPLDDHPLVGTFKQLMDGEPTGRELQSLSSKLNRVISREMKSPGGDRDLGLALVKIKNMTDDALESTLQGKTLQQFREARSQYRNLINILNRQGVVNESTGNVSAANLAGALKKADRKGFSYGRNDSDLYTAARFGQAFKPIVGDSGTATRQFLGQMLLSGGVGAGVGGASGGDPLTGLMLGLGAPMAARGAQAAYLSRPVSAYLANQILKPAGRETVKALSAPVGLAAAMLANGQ